MDVDWAWWLFNLGAVLLGIGLADRWSRAIVGLAGALAVILGMAFQTNAWPM